MLKIPSLLKSLKEIQTFKPDEIMISTPGPIGLVGLLSAKLLSISAIGVYHTDFTRQLTEIAGDDSTALIVEKATNWFYSIMDEIKVPTNAYIEILSERGLDKKKMSIFPRQIDSEMFSYCGNAEPEEDGFKLIYVGRISKDKNLEFLARAYKEAKKQIEDLNLTIVGDGPYLSDLKKFFDSSDAVRFTGRVPYSQLPQLYSQADLLVFPSETDTFGMVVLEAQCCELPALVSDKGGPKEIIKEDYTGYSLPTGEEQIWVDKIKQIAKMKRESPEEFMQMRRNSRSNAIEASNWENVLQNFASEILEPAFEMIND
jgi:glycosyltransferase involved in cell wall biosynthesis